jgi:CheY-like chemotaxis protein
VSARSPGLHCGATFTITLPTAAAPATEPEAAPSGERRANERLAVLLIEDHEDTAEVMVQLIRGLGHDTTVATGVADAMAAARATTFDLVISDVGLPDGTGLDFIASFRERSAAPAVAMTGFGSDDDVRRCLAAGFTSHLTKPVNFLQLEQIIESAAHAKAGDDSTGIGVRTMPKT